MADDATPWLGRTWEVTVTPGGVSLILDGGSPIMPTSVARTLATALQEAAAAADAVDPGRHP